MSDKPPRTEDPDATLKPPQFTLRTLLIGMALVAVLLGVMSLIGVYWSLAIGLLMILVAGHVAGNSLGTKLREGAPRRQPPRAQQAHRPAASTQRDLAMPTRLRVPARLHWINIVLSALGALAGGYFGGRGLVASYPDAPTSAFVLAYVSSGVLGGFAGFITSSFLSVTRQALSEAHAGSDRHRPNARPSPPSADRP